MLWIIRTRNFTGQRDKNECLFGKFMLRNLKFILQNFYNTKLITLTNTNLFLLKNIQINYNDLKRINT